MKNNMLKVLAMKAKNRMINKGLGQSYYDARIKVISDDDTEFVGKVRKILADEKASRNPLKLLMDDKKILMLDEKGREKYLLETMEKYLKAKSQIEREQSYRSIV